VIGKVKALFHGHPELVLGFNTFLPKGYEIRVEDVEQPRFGAPPAKSPVEFDQAISYVNKIKQRFSSDERVYKAFLEILNMYRKGQKTIANVYEEVALLFRSHADLLNEFTYFLPDNSPPAAAPRRGGGGGGAAGGAGAYAKPRGYGGARAAPPRRAPPLRRDDPKVQREVAFFEKVRARVRNQAAYEDFLKCLNLFAEDVISKAELVALAADVIGSHRDLAAGLNEFLMRCELGPEDPYARAYPGRADRSRHATLQQKYISLPISELDVATWERTTPSYVALPANYPRLKVAGRDALGASVLNDEWVSVTSGSEDFNFKHFRKNQYEDFLFLAEDDHFELDVVLDQCSSAVAALKPLAAALAALPEEERGSWAPPANALRAFHYRAVARIYGEQHGAQVAALLRTSPAAVIPTVLPRLEQKQAEWEATQAEMMPRWQGIFRENYAKSLDHRSFYFKQAEKKDLMPRLLVQEARDAADKARSERVAVLLALAGRCDFALRVAPHLSLPYDDAGVAADCDAIVQMGIDNMLAADAAAKVRGMYHSFVEAFLELPCSCAEAEERRRAAAARGGDLASPRAARAAAAAAAKAAAGDAPSSDGGGTGGGGGALRALGGLAGGAAESSDEEMDEAAAAVVAAADEEEDESGFVGCRPIVPVVAGGAPPPAAPRAPRAAGAPPRLPVFYASEPLYLFFRLHHILYDRLRAARACAAQREAARAEGAPSAAEAHARFMALAQGLLEGRVDPGVYEDDVRALLGTASFQLFTLDKLVLKVVRQAAGCLADEGAARLMDLWRYEAARGAPAPDAVYHANARVVLGDEPCFRLERAEGGAVGAQLMEADRSDATPAVLEPGFLRYVEAFVDGEAGPGAGAVGGGEGGAAAADLDGATRVCLRRNLARRAGSDAEVAAEALLARARRASGLECKLGSSAAQQVKKVAYVLGTEDFFHLGRGAAAAAAAAAGGGKKGAKAAPAAPRADWSSAGPRAAKFKAWVEARAPPPAATA
jgi:paired amphipathic helix protein Sin3a